MDSGLKQRLIGAAVLIALAVIFLPMLVKGPAPDSGVSDLPLALPDAPAARGDTVTRDLPLIAPPPAPEDGGVLEARRRGEADAPAPRASGEFPTVDTADGAGAADGARSTSADDAALPASTAAGDYAVHFGSYGSSVNADTVVNRLSSAGFPASSTQATASGKPVWRVRIGPYATRAEAEAVRVAATEVGPNDARVIALDAAADGDTRTASAARAPASPSAPPPPTPSQQPQPSPQPRQQARQTPPPAPQPPAPAPAPAAAAGTGFVVQLGAFRSAADAEAMRERVRALGFSAFTDTVQTEQGQLTRVKAGPVLDRAEADRLRGQISSRAGIDGMVRANP